MTKRAVDLLKKARAVAGYTTYIDLIKEKIQGKEIIATGMKKEVERVAKAVNNALSGTPCALISGGDPGVYAMAGLVFEMCRKKNIVLVRYDLGEPIQPEKSANRLAIEIVPGLPALPALSAGASLLGAPLTHDFTAVSLSDLLTPWETIEKRLAAAASADFVIVLYNPKSRKRNWQLTRAKEIIMEHRDSDTQVGIVTAAMRESQSVLITTLEDMDAAEIDMQTVVFVGSSATETYDDFMYTPRGYSQKYALDSVSR
ncbi:MAG: precorrin-3B C(17)-methyltransferase [Thermodesulfobacteriota bacterium]|nr:precorrin-3B C(17)-methyltransferase [Thermodesulfobacteriota bacterium]